MSQKKSSRIKGPNRINIKRLISYATIYLIKFNGAGIKIGL
jgi:hypothetical protein